MTEEIRAIVTTDWLADQMTDPTWLTKLRILDTTWNEPDRNRDFRSEHFSRRILASIYFDVQECCDHKHKVQEMLPTSEQFEAFVSDLGVSNDHHVIIYENNPDEGMFTGPRVWLEFKVFGHDKVSVLDGGLPKWIADGFATASGDYSSEEILPESRPFKALYRPEFIVDFDFMMRNVEASDPVQIIDTRQAARFLGIVPEPVPGVPSGHLPRSVNIESGSLFACGKSFKVMKTRGAIGKMLEDRHIDVNKDIVCTCLVGLSASIMALALFHLFGKICRVYDGSWMEWHVAAPVENQVRLTKRTGHE